MARTIRRLKALTVVRTTRQGLYPDGGGLYLQVTGASAKSWLFRYRFGGRERQAGLGSCKTYGLETQLRSRHSRLKFGQARQECARLFVLDYLRVCRRAGRGCGRCMR